MFPLITTRLFFSGPAGQAAVWALFCGFAPAGCLFGVTATSSGEPRARFEGAVQRSRRAFSITEEVPADLGSRRHVTGRVQANPISSPERDFHNGAGAGSRGGVTPEINARGIFAFPLTLFSTSTASVIPLEASYAQLSPSTSSRQPMLPTLGNISLGGRHYVACATRRDKDVGVIAGSTIGTGCNC